MFATLIGEKSLIYLIYNQMLLSTDVDECSVAYNLCSENKSCRNAQGFFWCACGQGYNYYPGSDSCTG